MTLFEKIEKLPTDGEFYKNATKGTYLRVAGKLQALGMTDDEIVELIGDLYNATASEFGA